MQHPVTERLDPSNQTHVDGVAALHEELVPESVPSRLGAMFMRRFYLKTLVADSLLEGYVSRAGEEVVGFVLFTGSPFVFFAAGARRHPFRLAAVVLATLLRRPRKLKTLWEIVSERKLGREAPVGSAQWLTFGVREKFLSARHADGRRVPDRLVDEMISNLHDRGFLRLVAAVRKSNMRAILFYQARGFAVSDDPKEKAGFLSVVLDLESQNVAP